MKKFQRLLVVVMLILVVLIVIEMIWYITFFKKSVKTTDVKKNPTMPVSTESGQISFVQPTSIPTVTIFYPPQITLTQKEEEEMVFDKLGFKLEDLKKIPISEIEKLASGSGISDKYAKTSLGNTISGRFLKLDEKAKEIYLVQNSKPVKINHDDIFILRLINGEIKISRLNYKEINFRKKFEEFIQPKQLIFIILLETDKDGNVFSNKIVVFK